MAVGIGSDIVIGRRIGVRLSGGGWTPVFLLRDDFTTTEAAPLASPRTCEPGPGTLTLVQTDGQLSISGGKLAFPAQTTVAWGDQGFYGAGVTRAAGVALLAKFIFSGVGFAGIGYHTVAAMGGDPAAWDVTFKASTFGLYLSGGTESDTVKDAAAPSTATGYTYATILRDTGVFFLAKGGTYTDWALLWVSPNGNGATLHPALSNYNAVGTLDTFRVLPLPAPFNTDYGIATNRIAGAVSAGATFTHEANCLIEYVMTTKPSSDSITLRLRIQDSSNYWSVYATSSNQFGLTEVVAGVPTNRANASITLSNGDRIVVIADGNTIRGYSANVLRWTYSSATTFATETDGTLNSLGTGGAVSDIVAWPRTLSGQAKTLLDAAIDA